ncbi:MAG: LON peptidase substrate-binding domain-containing protein, partial [Thermomicrobiaceae bacterium]|nr:LON peptidase substrate-binding domain-containing protein [Thermomicrobiaceae bacterium]
RYPLLPLKNVVVFPRNVVTLLVGRPRSIQAVEEAMARDRRLVVVAHRDPAVDDPQPADLHPVGTLVEIVSLEPQPGGALQVALEGLQRVRLAHLDLGGPAASTRAEPLQESATLTPEARALVMHIQELARRHQEAKNAFSSDVAEMIRSTTDPSHLADLLTTQLIREPAQRQVFLEDLDPLHRLDLLAVHLTTDLDLASLEQRIKERVREQIDKNQREYYLREQLKVIHDELAGGQGELETLRQRILGRGLPAPVEARLLKELTRLERMPAVSAEATVVRTYLDTVLELPWTETTVDTPDLAHAAAVLDADHFGLEPVKERLLEFLAVRQLTGGRGMGAQILCLVGPPGVGKTSLARSIATALGRRFVRVALGGVRDEAEIRGHRRTYIGALPGKIVSALKQAGTRNPVLLLDELDKLASDARGDPAAALLEVLDPEQHHAFVDHYLDLPFDLSQVLFIATANSLAPLPRPLRDRLELLELGGYSEAEKREIGKRHLLPKQLAAHGLAPDALAIPDKLWPRLIQGYTREAGVRQLERALATLCRKQARAQLDQPGQPPRRVRHTAAKLAA